MKKTTVLFSSGVLLWLSAMLPLTSQAAVTDEKEAEASFALTTPEKDILKITQADDLTFGSTTLKVDAIDAVTTADTEITIVELSGEAPGWTLTATLGDFKDKTTPTKTLVGAQLFYPEVTPTTNAVAGSPAALALPVAINTEDSFTGALKGQIVSAGGSATTIFGAAATKGYGQWTLPYKDANKVQLHVPEGQLIGDYEAKLTYTLKDTPTPNVVS